MKKALFAVLILTILLVGCSPVETPTEEISVEEEVYNPQINPADFTIEITNPYFTMSVGRKLVYKATTEEGIEKIEIFIPGWTKTIVGVETLVFWDRVYVNDELIEDTRDYIAQDKDGNVWYFGEDVDNYVNGKLLDHEGAWLTGVDGAKPGIWMPANPIIGKKYYQEYYKGIAEDYGRVDAVGVSVTVPAGTYNDCIKVFEGSPLFPDEAYKYHCKAIAATVLEEEEGERVELIEADPEGALNIPLPSKYAEEGVAASAETEIVESEEVETITTEVTEEQAKEIALKEVPGRVTDIAIEKKFGKEAYVVEIDADYGPETDVIIDIDTGEVLGIET